MLEIDPQLRGQEDEQQQQQQQEEHLPEASSNSYIYPEAAQISSTSHATDSDRAAALVQSLTAEDLPYYEGGGGGQLDGLPAGTTGAGAGSVYQPIRFTPHEPRKRPRSCESCRGLKVKCEPNESGNGPCKRCAKAGRECLYTESSGRRKKKEDNKVKELEQKVNGLTAALLAQRGAAASESLIYDDGSSILQLQQQQQHNGIIIGDDDGGGGEEGSTTKKRRRSEFEGDREALHSPRAMKHKVTTSGFDVDLRELDGLAKQKVMSDLCSNLKSLEAWIQNNRSHHGTKTKKSKKSAVSPAEVNGAGNHEKASKNEASTNGSHDAKTTGSTKAAPTAQMVRTPLDLLSQVASNEQPSTANQTQSEWYSPYASATQDASGYYDLKDEDGAGGFKSVSMNGSKSELEDLFHAEFGNRASLVLNFLNTFVATSVMKHDEEGR